MLLSADGWVLPTGLSGRGGQAIQTDSTGAVYLATVIESPTTDWDIVLRKYSADGTSEEWTQHFEVEGRQTFSDFAIDDAGKSLYIVGSYRDSNPFLSNGSTSGDFDFYVAKLSTLDGSVQWSRNWGTSNDDFGNGIDVNNGSVYVTGRLGPGEIDFDGTVLASESNNDLPGFILKIDGDSTAGDVIWAKQSTGTANSIDIAAITSPSNQTWVTIGGIVTSDVSFDDAALTTSERNQFVAQLIDEGSTARFTWARQLRASVDFRAIASDETGIYATGDLRSSDGQVDFGSGFTLESRGSRDSYLVRLDHNDGSTVWANQLGGIVYNLTTDGASNQLLVTGAFSETAEFDSDIYLTSHGSLDGFLAAYDVSAGSQDSVRRMGGSLWDITYGVSYRDGWVYAAGRSYSLYADFPVSQIAKSDDAFVSFSAGTSEDYVAKFGLGGPSLLDIAEPSFNAIAIANESVAFTAVTDAITVTWTSSIDGYVGEGTNLTASLSAGRHFITAKATNSENQSVLAGTMLYVYPSSAVRSDSPLDAPKEITDAKGRGTSVTTSSLSIADATVIRDLDIYLDIQHSSTPDLDVTLISPTGTRVELFSDLGNTFDRDFSQTFLDDEAELSIATARAPFTGRFQPETPEALSAFDGEDAQGTWTLEIVDDSRNNTGILNDWWLVIDGEVSRGITVSPTSGLVTGEAGGVASFDVVLDTEPTADVTIAIASNNEAEGVVDQASLTFTAANWNVPQTVTVTGVDDAVQDGDVAYSILTSAAVSTDPDYNGLDPVDVAVTNLDNEAPPVGQNVIYVQDIWHESRQRGKNSTDYRWLVLVREDTNGNGIADDGDLEIAGVTVTLTFNGVEHTGTTDASGLFQTGWIRDPQLSSGDHYANVDLALLDYTWNRSLDQEDDSDGDLLGLPDAFLTI